MISSDRLAKIFNLHANTKFQQYMCMVHRMHSQRSSWENGVKATMAVDNAKFNYVHTNEIHTHTKELMYKRMSHVICSVLFLPLCRAVFYLERKKWTSVCVLNIRCHSSEVLRFRHSSSSFQFQCDCFDSFWSVLCFTLVAPVLACSRNCCAPMWWYTIWINAHCL